MAMSRRSFLRAGVGAIAAPVALGTPLALFAAVASDQTPAITPSHTALDEIPPGFLALYHDAARDVCPRLPWTVLAAIGYIESRHNPAAVGPPLDGGPGVARIPASSYGTSLHGDAAWERAVGMMQFLPATFRGYAITAPGNAGRPADPFDPADAVYSAAGYLCANGADDPGQLQRALLAYNRSTVYVADVLDKAAHYAAAAAAPAIVGAGSIEPDYLAVALTQKGKPYRWGGAGPNAYDCSGIIHWALAQVGISIPRVSAAQARHVAAHGLDVPVDTAAGIYGALVFRIGAGSVNHVAMSLGDGRTFEAWRTGQPLQTKQIAGRIWTSAGLVPGVSYT